MRFLQKRKPWPRRWGNFSSYTGLKWRCGGGGIKRLISRPMHAHYNTISPTWSHQTPGFRSKLFLLLVPWSLSTIHLRGHLSFLLLQPVRLYLLQWKTASNSTCACAMKLYTSLTCACLLLFLSPQGPASFWRGPRTCHSTPLPLTSHCTAPWLPARPLPLPDTAHCPAFSSPDSGTLTC